jgi:hypothetical protein
VPQAMSHSFEQLEALANGNTRDRSKWILDLSQANASQWDKDAWKTVQNKLIAQTKAGL